MINTLGLLEVDSVVVAVDVVNVMLKAANVRLLSHKVLDPGRLMLMAKGGLAACYAVLDAGSTAAACTGRVINHEEVGRPDGDTQWLIGGFKRQPKKPEQKPEAKTEVKPEETQDIPVMSESSV